MKNHVSALAKVQLTVEVNVGPWSSSESFESLRATVAREAEQAIDNMLQKHHRARRIGEAKTVSFLVVEDES